MTNRRGGRAEPQVHLVRGDVVVQDPGHLRVQPRHQPFRPLHYGRGQPAVPERLGELQPDVAAADDDRAGGALVELGDDPVHVGDVAQHIHPRVIRPRDRRPDRLGPRAQHQLVVGLPVGPLRSRGRAPPLPSRRGRCGSRPARSARPAPAPWPRLSGVCSSRLSRSGMTPPMWYGKPQFANET